MICPLSAHTNPRGGERMDVFDVLRAVGGLCLFLFGMSVMGQALERRAGNRLEALLGLSLIHI